MPRELVHGRRRLVDEPAHDGSAGRVEPTPEVTGKSPFGVRPLDTGIAVRRQVRALLQVSSDTIWRAFG